MSLYWTLWPFSAGKHTTTQSQNTVLEKGSLECRNEFFVIVGKGVVSVEKRRRFSVFGEVLKSITLSISNHDEEQLNSVPRITKYLICYLSKHYVVLEIHEDISTVDRSIYCYQRLLEF